MPPGHFQGTAGPAERGTSWFILPKGHRERRQGKSHTAEKHGQFSCPPYGSGLRHWKAKNLGMRARAFKVTRILTVK